MNSQSQLTIVQFFKSYAAAQKCLLSFSMCFQKSVSKALYWFLCYFYFGVKQHTVVVRIVVAAYDLKNCTMVHYDNVILFLALQLFIWPYSNTCEKRPLKKDTIHISMTNNSLMMVESISECSPWSILQYFWPAFSDNWSWKPIISIFECGQFSQVFSVYC